MNTRKNLSGSMAAYAKSIPDWRWEYLAYQNSLSDQIATFIEKKSISKADIARELETSRAYVTKVLRGDANMTIETFVKILNAIGAVPVTNIMSKEYARFFYGNNKHERSICTIGKTGETKWVSIKTTVSKEKKESTSFIKNTLSYRDKEYENLPAA